MKNQNTPRGFALQARRDINVLRVGAWHPSVERSSRMHQLTSSNNNLHPMNRPTENTILQDQRVMDPNDPHHPGLKIYHNSNINTAIYELNPPYAQKGQPQTCTTSKMDRVIVNKPTIDLPEGGPTRYSAYHGYKVT